MKHVTYDPTGWDELALERTAEMLWFNQTEGRSGALGVTWSSLPETRRHWWRYQALAAVSAYGVARLDDPSSTVALFQRVVSDPSLIATVSAASPPEVGWQVEVERALDDSFDEYVTVTVGLGATLDEALRGALVGLAQVEVPTSTYYDSDAAFEAFLRAQPAVDNPEVEP